MIENAMREPDIQPDMVVWAIQPEAVAAAFPRREGSLTVESSPGKRVGVIRVSGVIYREDHEPLHAVIEATLTNPDIGAVILVFDSPGGDAYNVGTMAHRLKKMRGRKPVVAYVDGAMASGAYWLGAMGADTIVAHPDAKVGSIGVLVIHTEISSMLQMAGVKPTIIRSGENKFEGSPLEPLSQAAYNRIQRGVNEIAAEFQAAMVAARHLEDATPLGTGEIFTAKEALARGLVDRIGTLDQVVSELEEALMAQDNLALMQAELAEARAKLAQVESVEKERAFTAAKAQALAPLRQAIQEGRLSPSVLEGAVEALDRQKGAWTLGVELSLPASFVTALMPLSATPLVPSVGIPAPTLPMTRPDAALADAIQRYAEDNRVDYNAAKTILARRQPQIFTEYWAGRKTIQAGRAL